MILDHGVDADAIHTELFHADPVPRAPRGRRRRRVEGAAHVTIKLDGRTSDLELRPDDVGVLEAALRVRSDLPFACRGGVCGTCRAKLVEGTVAMDVNYALEPEEIEDGYVLTCQSHPTSDARRPRLRRVSEDVRAKSAGRPQRTPQRARSQGASPSGSARAAAGRPSPGPWAAA